MPDGTSGPEKTGGFFGRFRKKDRATEDPYAASRRRIYELALAKKTGDETGDDEGRIIIPISSKLGGLALRATRSQTSIGMLAGTKRPDGRTIALWELDHDSLHMAVQTGTTITVVEMDTQTGRYIEGTAHQVLDSIPPTISGLPSFQRLSKATLDISQTISQLETSCQQGRWDIVKPIDTEGRSLASSRF